MGKRTAAVEMTAKWLQKLRPPETGRVEHYDLLVPGLALRVSATGNMSWVVLFRRAGGAARGQVTGERRHRGERDRHGCGRHHYRYDLPVADLV
jgi:hypothetical protein